MDVFVFLCLGPTESMTSVCMSTILDGPHIEGSNIARRPKLARGAARGRPVGGRWAAACERAAGRPDGRAIGRQAEGKPQQRAIS